MINVIFLKLRKPSFALSSPAKEALKITVNYFSMTVFSPVLSFSLSGPKSLPAPPGPSRGGQSSWSAAHWGSLVVGPQPDTAPGPRETVSERIH